MTRIDSLEVAMTKGEILGRYRKLSSEERRSFDRWHYGWRKALIA
jgi:hypothetical protein